MDEHEYSGQYTYGDYLFANRLHYNSRRRAKIVRVVLIVFLVMMVLFIAVNPRSVSNWVILVLWLILLAYPYTVLPIIVRWLWRKQVQLHHPARIVLAGDRILTTTPIEESSIRWLDHYLVSDRMVLLFTTPLAFVMLPRRFARNDSDFQYIQQFLKAFPIGKEGSGKLGQPGV